MGKRKHSSQIGRAMQQEVLVARSTEKRKKSLKGT
jgi:hypothetical protein